MTDRAISVDRFNDLLRDYCLLQDRLTASRRSDFQTIISRYRPIMQVIREYEREHAPHFNVFDAVGCSTKELAHSSFLSYLLNPKGLHSQGTYFLEAFLRYLIKENKINWPIQKPDILKSAYVSREYHIGEEGRLDIFIRVPNEWIIAIENKVNADEGDDQIKQYQEWLSCNGADRKLILFLTPDGRAAKTSLLGSLVPIALLSYIDIADWLSPVVCRMPENMSVVVRQYIKLCKKIGGSDDISR